MRNISKKTRKKLVKVVEVNCRRVTHFEDQNATFVPYDSSPLSAIWKYLCIRNDGAFIGRFLVERSELKIKMQRLFLTTVVHCLLFGNISASGMTALL